MISDAGMWLPWDSHYAGIQGNSLGWIYKVFGHYSMGLIKDSMYSRSKISKLYFVYSSSSVHGLEKS